MYKKYHHIYKSIVAWNDPSIKRFTPVVDAWGNVSFGINQSFITKDGVICSFINSGTFITGPGGLRAYLPTGGGRMQFLDPVAVTVPTPLSAIPGFAMQDLSGIKPVIVPALNHNTLRGRVIAGDAIPLYYEAKGSVAATIGYYGWYLDKVDNYGKKVYEISYGPVTDWSGVDFFDADGGFTLTHLDGRIERALPGGRWQLLRAAPTEYELYLQKQVAIRDIMYGTDLGTVQLQYGLSNAQLQIYQRLAQIETDYRRWSGRVALGFVLAPAMPLLIAARVAAAPFVAKSAGAIGSFIASEASLIGTGSRIVGQQLGSWGLRQAALNSIKSGSISGVLNVGTQYGANIYEYGFGMDNFANWNIPGIISSTVFKNPFASALIGNGLNTSFDAGYNGFNFDLRNNLKVGGYIFTDYLGGTYGNYFGSAFSGAMTSWMLQDFYKYYFLRNYYGEK